MRFFIDTEFNERRDAIDLISIAIVAEDGREFYAVNRDCAFDKSSDWVHEHVLPKLPPKNTWITREEIARRVVEFVGDKPEFWAYYADYDWVVFCWLFGSMIYLPEHFPKYCLDLKQVMHERRIDRCLLPNQPNGSEHDALADARWVRDAWQAMQQSLNCAKQKEFRNTVDYAYNVLRKIDSECPKTITRFAAHEGRALHAWSKLNFDNWDSVARALVLLSGFFDKLARSLNPTNAPKEAWPYVLDLHRDLQSSIDSAIRLLSNIIDDCADNELTKP